VELFAVQVGRDPADWKPMPAIGPGVREIRVRDESGAYREKTPQKEIELTVKRLKDWKALQHGNRDLR
jgi:phage-related protein